MNTALREKLEASRRFALPIGAAFLVLSMVLGFLGFFGNFFQSYLYSYLFWIGLSAGCLVLLLVIQMAGGSWGAMIRRPLEAGAMTIPLMALAFFPILVGMGQLYPWTSADYLEHYPIVAAKTGYLNVSFFIIRALIYFAIWSVLAYFLYQWSSKEDNLKGDTAASDAIFVKMQRWGAGGMVIFMISMTFASFDWAMSLRPDWFSGIYGLIFVSGQAISALSLIILLMLLFAKSPAFEHLLTPKRVQDLGNFLLGITMFWTYVNISQLIIIWSGNMVETNTWLVARLQTTPWRGVSLFLLLFHFLAPFLVLFSRWVKRRYRYLAIVAAWMIFMRLVDTGYYLFPEFARQGAQVNLLDITVLIGLGGIWVWIFLTRLLSRPLVPQNDPRLALDGEAAH